MVDPLISAAAALGDSLLRPDAERVDVEGVPRSHIDALGAAGLLGIVAPTVAGGADAPAPVVREVTERLAAADASTWFVWTQHHTPVRTLSRGTNEELRVRWLPSLAGGGALAGVAYTHLRRPGTPALTARRDGDGWRLRGEIAWLTSWALADVFCIGAQCDEDVVWMFATLRDESRVQVDSLALAAMGGTSTVRVRIEELPVPASDVALVEPLDAWRATDAARTADVSPAVLGITEEAVRRLRVPGAGDEQGELADAVAERLHRVRAAAYDAADAGGAVAERLRLRAEAHQLACTATAGLVAAGGGRSMLRDQAAQRLARTALFLLVQGQTAAVRAATLAALSRSFVTGERAADGG